MQSWRRGASPSSHLLRHPLCCGAESRMLRILSSVLHPFYPVYQACGGALGFRHDAAARSGNLGEIEAESPFGAPKVLGS